MCFYGDGYASVFEERTPRARKDHPCDECRETIPKGTRYTYVFCVVDGDAMTFKVCDACEALRKRIAEHEIAEGCRRDESICPLGQLADYLSDRHELFEDRMTTKPIAALREAFMKLPLPTPHALPAPDPNGVLMSNEEGNRTP